MEDENFVSIGYSDLYFSDYYSYIIFHWTRMKRVMEGTLNKSKIKSNSKIIQNLKGCWSKILLVLICSGFIGKCLGYSSGQEPGKCFYLFIYNFYLRPRFYFDTNQKYNVTYIENSKGKLNYICLCLTLVQKTFPKKNIK